MAEPTTNSTPAPKQKTPQSVLFISSSPEPYSFKVMGINALRYQKDPAKLCWNVPARDVDRFKRHHFCKRGRVVPEA